ncbi:MAG: hypothetical protein ACTSVU_05335 [Promethearchaeota archaeon]
MPEQAISDASEKIIECNIDELKSYRFLLGDFGISMLLAIARGAQSKESIKLLSGVPSACIKGRMPVLLNLKLIRKDEEELFFVTAIGTQFLKCIDEM